MVAFKFFTVLSCLTISVWGMTTHNEVRHAHSNHAALVRRGPSEGEKVVTPFNEPNEPGQIRSTARNTRRKRGTGRCKSNGGPPQATPSQQAASPPPPPPPAKVLPTTSSSSSRLAPVPITPSLPPPPAQSPSPPPPPPVNVAPAPPPPAQAPPPAPTTAPSSGSTGGSSVLTQQFTGDATFYAPGLGACGQTNSNTDFIAAAAHDLFDTFPGFTDTANPNTNPICGKSVTASVNGKEVTVTIVDRCAGCDLEGSLDFSPSAFDKIADESVGRVHGMTWRFN